MAKQNPELPPITIPQQVPDDFGISYFWKEHNITAICENFSSKGGELKADLEIWHKNGNGNVLLHNSNFNVLSMTQQNNLRTQLSVHSDKIDWRGLVNQICFYSKQYHRENNTAELIDGNPKKLLIDYLLKPLIEKNKYTVLCAPGGSAKSYIGTYVHVILEHNASGLGGRWTPSQRCTGLYLDWESDKETYNKRVRAVRKGLNIESDHKLHYRRCYAPIQQDIDYIRRYVFDNNIEFIVVDSQMAALGDNPNDAEPNDKFYNALRTLDCACLILDHVSKDEMSKLGGHTTPYGSVVKWNRARSVFALKKHQIADEDYIQLTLTQTKHNDGKLNRPIGIQVDFINTPEAEPDEVIFKYVDPAELEGELSADALPADRIYRLLIDEPDHDSGGEIVRGWTLQEISKKLEINFNTVKQYITQRQSEKYMITGERKAPFRYVAKVE